LLRWGSCLGWSSTVILQISASWIAGIADVSHCVHPNTYFKFRISFLFMFSLFIVLKLGPKVFSSILCVDSSQTITSSCDLKSLNTAYLPWEWFCLDIPHALGCENISTG
jgi:hypothetical protein